MTIVLSDKKSNELNTKEYGRLFDIAKKYQENLSLYANAKNTDYSVEVVKNVKNFLKEALQRVERDIELKEDDVKYNKNHIESNNRAKLNTKQAIITLVNDRLQDAGIELTMSELARKFDLTGANGKGIYRMTNKKCQKYLNNKEQLDWDKNEVEGEMQFVSALVKFTRDKDGNMAFQEKDMGRLQSLIARLSHILEMNTYYMAQILKCKSKITGLYTRLQNIQEVIDDFDTGIISRSPDMYLDYVSRKLDVDIRRLLEL